MIDNTPDPQSNTAGDHAGPFATQQEEKHVKLRNIAVVLTVILFLVVVVTLLYLNGKNIYNNGI